MTAKKDQQSDPDFDKKSILDRPPQNTPEKKPEPHPEDKPHQASQPDPAPPQKDPMALLYTALAMAQGEFPEIKKTKTAKVKGRTKSGKDYDFSYKYADLADILKATAPVRAKYGLGIIQRVEKGFLQTMLTHEGGAWIDSTWEINIRQDNQALGSDLTYYRRYQVAGLLGVASDEDDDGAGALVNGPGGSGGDAAKNQANNRQNPGNNTAKNQQKAGANQQKKNPPPKLTKTQVIAKVAKEKGWADELMKDVVNCQFGRNSTKEMDSQELDALLQFVSTESPQSYAQKIAERDKAGTVQGGYFDEPPGFDDDDQIPENFEDLEDR